MGGMTADGKIYQYGTGDGDQPIGYPVGNAVQLYHGEVALVSGSGSVTTGYLKNAATAGSADLVVGMVDEPAGGTLVQTGPGILGGSADGLVWVNVRTGTFFFQSGTGSDLLSAATNGLTVYYGGENATGPLACKLGSTGGLPRPVLGVQMPQDPGIAGGFSPGSSYFPVCINPNLGRP